MKILICTGIFPPDIGGPAQYAKNLREEFIREKHQVKVMSYKFEKKLPSGLRHCFYFLKIIPLVLRTNLIIALDTFSVGLPVVCAAKIFGKKIIVRVGGDFLWETYVEKTGHKITLKDFYCQKPQLPLKHKFIAFLEKFTLRNASVLAFNTLWQKELFQDVYGLNASKTFAIENYYGGKNEDHEPKEKNFLFGGRRIKFKNLEILQKIFEEFKREGREINLEIIDNLSYDDLLEKIKHSYALIVPSISDFAPNFIIEGLSANKPFILTKNCGLVDKLRNIGIFVDPFSKDDIKSKILFLANEQNYKEYKERVANFNFTHSWKQIAGEFLEIYKKL